MNEEKHADNAIVSRKIMVDNIDMELDTNKKTLNSLDDIEENFNSLKRNIDSCVDLLNRCVKGGNIQRKLNAISENNVKTYNDSMKAIYEKRDSVNNEIRNLYNEKDKINNEIKEIYNEKIKREEGDKDGN